MKVKSLIEKLGEYNKEAVVNVIVDNYPVDWSLCFGGYDGCTKDTCVDISFYVESSNNSEKE